MEFVTLAKKSISTIVKEGPIAFVRKANRYLKDRGTTVQIPIINKQNYYLKERFRKIQAIDNFVVNGGSKKRLNLVTDSINDDSLFGGVATSIIIAAMFANRHDLDLRIITRESVSNPSNFYMILDMNNIRHPKNCSFFSDCGRDVNGKSSFKLDVSENDIFIATSWWTAESIRKTTIRKRFYYIIQEVETFFYPHGDEHLLCSQIMENTNIDFIVNSHYLWEWFQENNNNIVNNGEYFEPAFSRKIFDIRREYEDKTKYKLFFYSRPNNPRNLFAYGLILLDESIKRGILDTNEWDIYMVGQNVPYFKFCNDYKANNLGVLNWSEYATFLKDVDLTLSLMYTPHPSYPPYDAACSGSVVITNSYKNKIKFTDSKNVIISELEIDSFMENMCLAIDLAKNMEKRIDNIKQCSISREWESTLVNVMKFMDKGLL